MFFKPDKNSLHKLYFALLCTATVLILYSCTSFISQKRASSIEPVSIPFMRLEQAGECYYIDDFLPTPNHVVTGKSSGLNLRYYTYWNAKYKNWNAVGIMLSFYSKDSRCWGLFEEYILPKQNALFE